MAGGPIAYIGGFKTNLGIAAGFTGQKHLATQDYADWGSRIINRPTELVDGRVGTALTSQGRIKDASTMFTAYQIGVRSTTNVAMTASDAGSTASIYIPQHQRKIPTTSGTHTITYNSGTITGLAFSTRYYAYADDPSSSGGNVTYVASTSPDSTVGNAGRVFVDYVTTPANGGSGTGGGYTPPGGGGGGGPGTYIP